MTLVTHFVFQEEWIVKGNEIVEQMLERVPKKEMAEAPLAQEPETAPLGGSIARRRGSSDSKG